MATFGESFAGTFVPGLAQGAQLAQRQQALQQQQQQVDLAKQAQQFNFNNSVLDTIQKSQNVPNELLDQYWKVAADNAKSAGRELDPNFVSTIKTMRQKNAEQLFQAVPELQQMYKEGKIGHEFMTSLTSGPMTIDKFLSMLKVGEHIRNQKLLQGLVPPGGEQGAPTGQPFPVRPEGSTSPFPQPGQSAAWGDLSEFDKRIAVLGNQAKLAAFINNPALATQFREQEKAERLGAASAYIEQRTTALTQGGAVDANAAARQATREATAKYKIEPGQLAQFLPATAAPHYFQGPEGTQYVVPGPGQQAQAVPGAPTGQLKTQTEEQLTQTAMFHPDPGEKAKASAILNAMQGRKIEIAAATAGATETAKMNADKAQAEAIIKQSNLVQRLLDGRTAPEDLSQSFRQPWVRILAVGEAMKRDPNYNEIQADANKRWYQSPTTQRLIRRTESIVAPNGAADEAIRFAKLVDNPAGTPVNKLTGQAKVMFGNSQRSLLGLVQGITSEEIQQIMGAQGGGERFLEFTQALNDPNLSVQQYVNNVNELKYLIYTRQVANVRGTPEQKSWEKMGAKFTQERPFAPPPPSGIVPGVGEGGAGLNLTPRQQGAVNAAPDGASFTLNGKPWTKQKGQLVPAQ